MDKLKLNRKLTFLYTNIGRGHPFYLDGIAEALIRKGQIKLVRKETDVFELSSGISKLGWQIVRLLYKYGAQDGIRSRLYTRLRRENDYNQESLIKNILGSDLKKHFNQTDGPVLVAHPLLASILVGKVELFYQHGELITPKESVVNGIDIVFVPTEESAEPFFKAGYTSEQVIITGLCIEPALVRQADDCYQLRMQRLSGQKPLCGAFFSSGAEPKKHLIQLVETAFSAVENNQKVIVFAKNNGYLASGVIDHFEEKGIALKVIDSKELIPHDLPPASLVLFNTRREENSLTAKLFNEFDYLVSPAHERTNWSMGLGLPTFILTPNIGPFAPLNAQLMLEAGVANNVGDNSVRNFGKAITALRKNGQLQKMAHKGWGRKINGFEVIGDYLDSNINL